jgi:hypothetical protein
MPLSPAPLDTIPGLVTDDPSAGRFNRAAIEAALDGGAPVLRLPPGSVYLDKPLWWRSGRSLIGEPDGRSALRTVTDDGPLVLMPCWPMPADRAPDAFGQLDASAAPRPGVRWGYRTADDGHLAQSAGVLSIMAGYYELPRLTIEAAIDSPGLKASGSIMGLSASRGDPSPWIWVASDGGFYVAFATKGPTAFSQVAHSFRFKQSGPGLHRYVITIDCAAGTVAVAVDGFFVGIDGAGLGAFKPGSVLAPNDCAPFLFGSSGGSALTDTAEVYSNAKHDLTLYGLRLGTHSPYLPGLPGDRLERLDGRPTADSDLFRHEAGTIALLPLTDPPGDRQADRLLSVLTPGSVGHAMMLSAAHARPEVNLGSVAVERLSIRGKNPWLGIGVVMANTLHVRLSDLSIGDVAIPVSCIGTSANYPVLIERCSLNGTDAAALSRFGMWTIRDCHSGRAGRTLLRADRAAQIRIDGWFCEGVGTPETIFRLTDGCRITARGLDVDFEDGKYPSVAAFYATPGGHHARAGSLWLESVGFGAIPKTAPFVWLDAAPGVTSNATFGMSDIAIATAPQSYVRVTGQAWSGGFHYSELMTGWSTVPVHKTGEGVRSKVGLRQ